MKEYIFRRGYESIYRAIRLPWYLWLFFFGVFYIFEERKYFIDLVNDKGIMRRIYIKNG